MIIVIQCAGRKKPDAGHLLSPSGKPILFVADPASAPVHPAYEYARPDDPAGDGLSWRQVLLQYNAKGAVNPLGLCPAYQLYKNRVYGRLVDRFGLDRVYILSAGWGLIRSDFLTPNYDITFSVDAEPYKLRRKRAKYADFRMLATGGDEEVVFLGGIDYVGLFGDLTKAIESRKTVYYNSEKAPFVEGCAFERFVTKGRTNWHYRCAQGLIDGTVGTR